MSIHKITPFLSDIKDFFKKSDMTAAMQAISSVLSHVRMTERATLAVTNKHNCVYRLLTVFQCLLLFPCFGIRNAFRNQEYGTLAPLIRARKDVFYRFLENPCIDWRKALWHISVQLWKRIHLRSDHKSDDVCLILDDTDYEKTGRTIEKIGRVHSHLAHKAVLGFKCLCMAVTDGVSQILLDFALLGEKGKKGNYGMSARDLKRRRITEHDSEVLRQREKEYDMSKIELAKDMIKRAIRRGIRFSYVLADSWFTNKELIRFIHRRHIKCHWLGMIKVGENGRTKYHTGHGDLTAPALVRLGKRLRKQKYSRKLKCSYIMFDATFGGVPVRIFLVRRTQHGRWNGLLTTDTELDFLKAWEIYSRRWSLEVVFKDCKTNLGFGKCQSTCFASQIAAAALCCLQYDILSTAKRFSDYETIGGLFRDVSKDTLQLSVAQQIWGVLQEIVSAIAEVFGMLDEEVYDVVINHSKELAHIIMSCT
ncbi:MAG: transposase [Muribaculaceae bacterium]|nr:transposase [Muribaculaceae bacterium]